MRVGIDATCWSNRRGYGRFTRALVRAVLEADSDHEFVLFFDVQALAEISPPDGCRSVTMHTDTSPALAASASGRRSLADLRVMSEAVRKVSLDVFFFPSVYSYFPLRQRPKVILGIHDVIAEDYPEIIFPSPWRRQLWTIKSWLARRQADYLMTVSEHAREGVLRRFDHPPDRVRVIGEAADSVFRPMDPSVIEREVRDRLGLAPEDRFIAYLGGVNPHKNLDRLVESLGELTTGGVAADLHLVVIGDIESDNFTPGLQRVRHTVDRLGLEKRVIFAGFLADEQAARVLNLAEVLVLPSMAEGFGLPAVEAAACGTPVVATANSPLPELMEGGGIFIDPDRPQELTEALSTILDDRDLRDRLGAIALKKASALSWERSAEQFLELLELVGELK